MPLELKLDELTESQIDCLQKVEVDDLDPLKTWRNCIASFSGQMPCPDALHVIWESVFENWDDSNGPRPIWSPTLEQIHQAHVAQWAAELGIHDYNEFQKWSVDSRAEFWSTVVDKLNIRFREKGDTVLSSDDAAKATWFPDAKMNIAESCFAASPEQPAIVAQRPGEAIRSISYEALDQRSNQIANGLIERGFKTGDAIAVVLPMTADSVAIYLGIVKAGMAVVSIADSFAANEIHSRLRISNAKAVFTYDRMLRAGKPIGLLNRVQEATEVPLIALPLNPGEKVEGLRDVDVAFDEFLSKDESFEAVACSAADATNILFSSGTTGDPKAIPWTHLTPIKCAVDGHLHQNIGEGAVAAWPTNLGWMMGPWLIYATLINRGTIALFEDVPMGEAFGKFVQDAKVNMLGVVPTIVKAWRNSACMEPFDWSAIECFSSTGEASQANDMFYLSALAGMKPVIEYCGGTEIGGGYITSTMVQPNVAAAFSTPAIGLGLEILDEAGQPADEGEIFLVGPSVGLSERLLNRDHYETYYADVPKSPRCPTLRKHGDFMRRLTGGYFMAGGRADDTMNLGGIKVSSAEIERVLNQIPMVRETAAVGFSESGPEQLVVFVVVDKSGQETPPLNELQLEMNRLLKQELNPLFKVASIEMIDLMPRTASNKVMRRKLRDQLKTTRDQAASNS